MKKLITIIGVVLLATVSQAQDTNGNVITDLGKGLSALGGSTNWGFASYVTLKNGKDKRGKSAYGGGFLGIYSLNKFMGLGGGVDTITGLGGHAQTTILSFSVQGQLPMHPLSLFWTNSFAENFATTPYLYSGLGTPLGSGISQSAVIHEAEGINLDIVKFGNWELGAGFALVQRQNAGAYNGGYKDFVLTIHHPF